MAHGHATFDLASCHRAWPRRCRSPWLGEDGSSQQRAETRTRRAQTVEKRPGETGIRNEMQQYVQKKHEVLVPLSAKSVPVELTWQRSMHRLAFSNA